APFISTELGDNKGILLGLNISSGRPSPVYLDLESTVVDQNASPAFAIAGELGAGKTLLLKKVSSQLVDRDGRMIAIDRTAQGEWAALADQITEATTVNVATPTVSLDVLRLFPGPAGARIAQSCLTALFNAAPSSPQGRLLADVLDPAWLSAHGVNSLGQLDQHLQGNRDLPGSDELASTLRAFSRKDFGRVLFDPDLPTLRLDSRAIVFLTAGLQLPSREELLHEHLFRQMRLERVFGRALYALIMGLVRHVAFADPSEMVAVALSEAHHITSSPEAADEVIELIRDGRKHKAAAMLDSHDPLADFGDETLRGLIPTRLVGRQSDKNLARNSLEWLGLDPDDDQLVQLLTSGTSPVNPVTGEVPPERRGEALMRDSKNRYGLVKILAPNDPRRRRAVMTTPPAARTTATARRTASAARANLHTVTPTEATHEDPANNNRGGPDLERTGRTPASTRRRRQPGA
ncbi:MAG TPA: ATP-binding protein, partial [Gemmataceae bacterium]|nr:ATP-binding protein [Gemmataceae bacterium]